MPDLTPNYNFNLPIVGSEDDVWGGLLNANWSALDAALKAIEDSIAATETRLQIKVGDLYFSTDASNPAAKLGYGTWEAYGEGRAIVGASATWPVDEERGAETVLLDADNIPEHTHAVPEHTVTSNDADLSGTLSNNLVWTNATTTGKFSLDNLVGGGDSADAELRRGILTFDGLHNHDTIIPAIDTGANTTAADPVAVTQPSIAVYVWRRTA